MKRVSCFLAVCVLLCASSLYLDLFPFLHLSQNQAKLFIEQKKIPFPVDNHNTNEELGKLASCSDYKNSCLHFTDVFWFFCWVMLCVLVVAAIGYVLIGNGLYDEAIKHFSLLLQVCLHPFNFFLLFLFFFLQPTNKNTDRFSWRVVLIQGDPELVSAIYGRGIAYGKKSLQVSDGCIV